MYKAGQGVKKNDTTAVKWYIKAAEQGNAGAQYNLGVMYEHGEGISMNYRAAVKWYILAAQQHHAGAIKWNVNAA